MSADMTTPNTQTQISLTQPVSTVEGVERNKPDIPPSSVAISSSVTRHRNGQLGLDVFSPVNQNGSFEFDRVLKSGYVHIRSRKTKQWKKFFLVLRPNLLSMYKNASEEKLLKQITLADLTAVASVKDPKGRRQHMFGLFSPSRNYHLQANSEDDARDWLELIRKQARIDEEEESMIIRSPTVDTSTNQAPERILQVSDENWDADRLGSSSPEPGDLSRTATTGDEIRIQGIKRSTVEDIDQSGNELGSTSDFSDAANPQALGTSAVSMSNLALRNVSNLSTSTRTPAKATVPPLQPAQQAPAKNPHASELSGVTAEVEDERVIWHGYLHCLKSKGGVRQWKRLWVVLRPKKLSFYKNEEEYSTLRLIPLSSIISAVEIDPVSRNKPHCMQIIAEDKSYRFAAQSEEALARCLGALKSQLAKRKEKLKIQEAPPANGTGAD